MALTSQGAGPDIQGLSKTMTARPRLVTLLRLARVRAPTPLCSRSTWTEFSLRAASRS